MSQIETLMLLALGCSATLFVVLLFGRGIWSLLGRWSGWKDARKVPRALRDLKAERDGLKAEKAMMASKLEANMSDMKLRLAEQMAEVSRNRNRLLDANGKLQMQADEMSRLKGEITRREEKIGALNVQIQENVKAIASAWAKTADHEGDAARAMGMHKEAISAVDMREERIRNLETEAKALREIIAAFLPGKDIAAEVRAAVGENPVHAARSALLENRPSLNFDDTVADLPVNVFQARFNTNTGNPLTNPLGPVEGHSEQQLVMPASMNDEPLTFPRPSEGHGPLDKGISNVLSLAERVRGLQKIVK
jgi:hypothetical protein